MCQTLFSVESLSKFLHNPWNNVSTYFSTFFFLFKQNSSCNFKFKFRLSEKKIGGNEKVGEE